MTICCASEYGAGLTLVFWGWSSWTFDSFDIISKGGEFNVTQDLNKSRPGHWLLASSIQPFLEDFHVDLFRIIEVFMGYDLDLGSILVIKEEGAKLDILGCYFNGNTDNSSIDTCKPQ